MASTLKRYRGASSETFKCIHVPRNSIKSRMFGKGQKVGLSSLRFISFPCGLLRGFCWWAIGHQGFHRDPALLTLAHDFENVSSHKLLPTPSTDIRIGFGRGEVNGLVKASIGLFEQC